ncbi:MAG: TIGR04076 family protein [Actinobacteria bacterium]|nr:TIGR04076 family protein [Actinomycetota bacterium]MSW62268.1 TIGR04076 family protein [Actinomycetota bacterium]MSX89347.1 TIGR04076 family protein [Actinomycetota bacterium]MTA57573.1 TIGR04076 family protein [Actinomycetota bacterium]
MENQADHDMELFELRIVVDRIEGRSVCGLKVGDYFEVTESSQLRIPAGKHFCMYAIQAAMPLLPAKQRQMPAHDWLETDSFVTCPDPDERLVMRIERTAKVKLNSQDLT